MPKTPTDYSRTIIYKICCNDVNITDCYVGHTTDLIKRRNQHKSCCNNSNKKEFNFGVYKFIRDNGGWDNWSVVPIEEYKCENVNQAKIRERYWIEELKSSLNKQMPTRTKKEYCEEKVDKLTDYFKQYYESNKENFKEKRKQHYEKNRDKINEKHKEYRKNNIEKIKEQRKEYYEHNKEIIIEKTKEYYDNNKERILEQCYCECGGFYIKKGRARHFKTKIHQNYLNTINQ